jgi:hypothetical protein
VRSPVRRIVVSTAVLIAMLVVLTTTSGRRHTSAPAASPPSPPAPVVTGTLPGDRTVVARPGDVVRLQVRSDVPDEAEIAALGVHAPADPSVPAELDLVAGAPGRYEVDLRYSARPVGMLVVAR